MTASPRTGRNTNQGAESTLALISTLQHAERLVAGGVIPAETRHPGSSADHLASPGTGERVP